VQLLSSTPRGGVRGPFEAMLHSPEFLNRTQALGAFLRYDSGLPQRLRELAILITARFWNQGYEWSMHAPIAAKAGLSDELIAAIAERRNDVPVQQDEETVLRFCEALHQNHCVTDDIYSSVQTQFGNAGVVELTGICGYYALLAMVMNVAHTPVPGNAPVPFPPPAES
jgi:4-carboxymuconolactone decarboxylase